ncbi:hypothetical protein ACOCJ4_02645 [Knoellia sp. CPCC 206435]|uniref:hypothetical protein n=1 Tax=Knoellia terrae TaxID=3404797 RepID=UPI003B433A0A
MSDIDLPPVGERLAQGDLDRMVQRLQRASQWQAATVSMTGQGRGRQVVATVDARGVLQSLDVPDVACRGDGAELAGDVVAAITAAREDVASQLARAGRLAFGDDAPEVDTIVTAATARSRATIAAEGGSDGSEDADGTGWTAAPRWSAPSAPSAPASPPAHRSDPGHW